MKAILMSIKHKWCELIFSGKKTIEVRKTAPKLKPPFKVYVYETLGKKFSCSRCEGCPIRFPLGCNEGAGAVVGEFICDKIGEIDYVMYWNNGYEIATRLAYRECADYGKGKPLYGLHIAKPKLYDKPKELNEFQKPCKMTLPMCGRCEYYSIWRGRCENITRPPQSWMYVEELC